MMVLIWGAGQCCRAAADWHDGQIAHKEHARIARRGKRANQQIRGALLVGIAREGIRMLIPTDP
jgi:hypothetical protein